MANSFSKEERVFAPRRNRREPHVDARGVADVDHILGAAQCAAAGRGGRGPRGGMALYVYAYAHRRGKLTM